MGEWIICQHWIQRRTIHLEETMNLQSEYVNVDANETFIDAGG